MHLADEYELFHSFFDSPARNNPPLLERATWKPPDSRYLKVNTDTAFSNHKIGIEILVRNHLGIPLIAKAPHIKADFTVDYRELIGIIKSYVLGSFVSSHLIIECDSLLTIQSLSSQGGDLSELDSLYSHFFSFLDPSSISFSHVYRSSNCPPHLLAKLALHYL